ncbi:hypothetical protein B0T24DRAFT_667835 [Lasiosphaeria ovina]|uniref:Uncharacterized protein n=1 Tax=Lasiosphaeria ovina TaxID=92902 RepID=A0AAE0N5L4_9PEZI|nr:hypothetical protein B0T24DRAFT_667835 [Lasiosphaeria ovina]
MTSRRRRCDGIEKDAFTVFMSFERVCRSTALRASSWLARVAVAWLAKKAAKSKGGRLAARFDAGEPGELSERLDMVRMTSKQYAGVGKREWLTGPSNPLLNRLRVLGRAEINRILIKCIKLIINLKQQITNLVRFFKALASMVELCVKFHVKPFLETIKAIVAADCTDPYKDLRIGEYTLTDFQRSQVFVATVTLRSYFSVLSEVAKMWVDLSKENVFPGLALCDKLPETAEGPIAASEMGRRVAELNKWSREAAGRVAAVAHRKQAEIMAGM